MKIEDLTLEKFLEVADLLKQLHIPRSLIEMAKELDVKRTDLMRFVNAHRKNINLELVTRRKYAKNGSISSRKETVEVSGIYLNPRENPLTEEYAEDRKKEHRIKLDVVEDYGYICGFSILPYNPNEDWHSCKPWENQEDDVKAFMEIPEVKDEVSFAKGGFGDGWTDTQKMAFRRDDAEAVLKAAMNKGLRIFVSGRGECKTVEDMTRAIRN